MNLLNKRVYLSGPMTGIDDFNADAFREAEAVCRKAGAAHVYNPYEYTVPRYDIDHLTHEDAMVLSCRILLAPGTYEMETCGAGRVPRPAYDAIVQLHGWEASPGARLEAEVARACGIMVIGIDEIEAARAAA